ncbi:GNAT family N-acetyltransferase [Utexia brackfieldae]|uniref:GNAT family N-acetyltransferase n=1 Tax=Utexia brackfieldae TaxID=3074108 RepID=UPI00370DCBB4
MIIRPFQPQDTDELMQVWHRSVKATHHFLSQQDIDFYFAEIRDKYLSAMDIYVAVDSAKQISGFIGWTPQHIEMLFVDSRCFRQGIGKQLLEFALSQHPKLSIDVNEQNPSALAFYLAQGFVVKGRNELDSCGHPFPIIHLARRD